MATFTFVIKGQPGTISIRAFLAATQNALAILKDLDSAVSGQPKGTLDWVVKDLGTGSLTIEVESQNQSEEHNVGPEVVSRFVSGMGQIQTTGTTPAYFSEYSITHARRMLRVIGNDGTSGYELRDFQQTVELTAEATTNVDQLVKVRRHSIGSIEGRLEMISLHGKPRFIVYLNQTRKAVTCQFNDSMLEAVKAGLGRRVNVRGRVSWNGKGEPLRVVPESIRILRKPDELPSIQELAGSDPDFTGGMRSEEYVRRLRGA